MLTKTGPCITLLLLDPVCASTESAMCNMYRLGADIQIKGKLGPCIALLPFEICLCQHQRCDLPLNRQNRCKVFIEGSGSRCDVQQVLSWCGVQITGRTGPCTTLFLFKVYSCQASKVRCATSSIWVQLSNQEQDCMPTEPLYLSRSITICISSVVYLLTQARNAPRVMTADSTLESSKGNRENCGWSVVGLLFCPENYFAYTGIFL